jgi:hypothetical protein
LLQHETQTHARNFIIINYKHPGIGHLYLSFRLSANSSDALRQFRNYCGLIKIARCGFPWKKTTKWPKRFGQHQLRNCFSPEEVVTGATREGVCGHASRMDAGMELNEAAASVNTAD